jgi:hypothetical protein
MFLVKLDYMLIYNRSCVGLLSPTYYRCSRISHGPHQHCHYTAFIWRPYCVRASNRDSIPGTSYASSFLPSGQRFWSPLTFQAEGYWGRRRPGVKVTTQIQAVLRLTMRGATSPLMPSWNTRGQFHIYIYIYIYNYKLLFLINNNIY